MSMQKKHPLKRGWSFAPERKGRDDIAFFLEFMEAPPAPAVIETGKKPATFFH